MGSPKIAGLVSSFEVARVSPRYQVGDIIVTQDSNEMYQMTETGWELLKNKAQIEVGTLYDINKNAISQLPPLDANDISKLRLEIDDFIKKTKNKYYMLLSRDNNYFTVLTMNKENPDYQYGGTAVTDLFSEFADIITYDAYDEQIEIWVKNRDEVSYYVLFPYDAGVVTYKYE